MLLVITAFGLVIALAGAWVFHRSRALSRVSSTDYRLDLLSLCLLFLATLGFFWRIIFSSNVWRPAGGGDLAQFLYPTFAFAADALRRGEFPLWNPYLFGGMPYVGDIQSGLFYPINLLTYVVANPLGLRDMEFLSIFHFFLAGAGMFLLLRFGKFAEPFLSRGAALAGAAAFEFSDLFVVHFGNLNLIAVAAWLPLVFLFFRRALLERRPSMGVLSALALTLAFFAGHVQPFLFIVLVLVAYALYESLVTRQWAPYKYLFLTLALTTLLSAPSLLPALEMNGQTVRENFSYEQAAEFSLAPAQLIGLLAPGFFGRAPAQAWGPWPRVEVGYLGVLPLVLAVIALLLRRDRLTRFFGLLAVAGFALAFGGYGILHGWLYQFAPGFSQLRAPARFVFVADFALAVLAAFGFEIVVRNLADDSKRLLSFFKYAPWVTLVLVVGTGGTAYAILALSQNLDPVLFARNANATNALVLASLLLLASVGLILARRLSFFDSRAWQWAALALLFFDLFSLGAYVDLGTSDPTAPFQHDDVSQFLRTDRSVFRIDSRTDVGDVWAPDTALRYGLHDTTGDNPLVLGRFNTFWEALGSRSSSLYDLLNVKYVIAHRSTPLDAKFVPAFDGSGDIRVYENKTALPRAFIVSASSRAATPEEALALIHAPAFDPTKSVVLEGGSDRESTAGDSTGNSVTITKYSLNEITMQVESVREGYLVLGDVYYPGWHAFVDGTGSEILRADYLFRAIPIPAGSHAVRFIYQPLTLYLGAAVSALTIVGLIGWLVWKRRGGKNNAVRR